MKRRLLKTAIIGMISLLSVIVLLSLYYSLPLFADGEEIRPGSLKALFVVNRVLRRCPLEQALGQPMLSRTEDIPNVHVQSLHYISKGSPTVILSTTEKYLLENGFEKVGDREYRSGNSTIGVEVEDDTLAGQEAEHLERPGVRVSVTLWKRM